MAGSSAPVMYWAVLTTLSSALRSDALQLTYEAVMQPVKMLSMVQLLEDLRVHAKSFQPSEGEEALLCLLHNCVGVDHINSLVMWTQRDLKLSTCSTTATSMWMGTCWPSISCSPRTASLSC